MYTGKGLSCNEVLGTFYEHPYSKDGYIVSHLTNVLIVSRFGKKRLLNVNVY